MDMNTYMCPYNLKYEQLSRKGYIRDTMITGQGDEIEINIHLSLYTLLFFLNMTLCACIMDSKCIK